jgi:hypothetical protein
VWLEKGLKKYGNYEDQDRGKGWQNYIPRRYKLNKRGVVDSHVQEKDLNEKFKREFIVELFSYWSSSRQRRAKSKLRQLERAKRWKKLKRKQKERHLFEMWNPRHPNRDRRAYWCPILNEWVREARIVFFHNLDDVAAGYLFGKGSKDDKFTTANSMVVSKVVKDIWDAGRLVLIQDVDEEAAKEEIEVWRSMKRNE